MAGPPALAKARQALDAAVRWWLGELAGMVPARWRRFRPRGEALVLALGEGQAGPRALLEGAGQARDLGAPTPLDPPETLAARAGWRGGAMLLRLPASAALRLPMHLPLAAEGNLAEVVGFELDQQTPFRPEQVHVGHRLVGRDGAAGRLLLDLTLAPRPAVEEALRAARALGFEPDAVDVARPGAGPAAADRLHVPGLAGADGGGRDPVALALVALAALLAVAAVAAPLRAAHQAAEAVRAEFEAVRGQVEATAALARQVEAARGAAAALAGRRAATPTLSDTLLELTRLLPDDAWLTGLEVAGGQVRISGFAPSASSLVEALEASPLFQGTTFEAAVTRDQRTGRERFSLSARLEGAPGQGTGAGR